jgi:predicted small lipoprotein YifL
MRKTIRIVAIIAALIMCLTFLTGCKKKNEQPPAEVDTKTTEQTKDDKAEKSEKKKTEDATSDSTHLYSSGKTIVDANGNPTKYKFDDSGNIIDEQGNIVVKTDKVKPFSCVNIVEFKSDDLSVKLLGKLTDSGEIATRPQKFKAELSVKPEDAVNKIVLLSIDDPGMIQIKKEDNKDAWVDAKAEGLPEVENAVYLKANNKNKINLNYTVAFSGYSNIVIKNVQEVEVDTMTVGAEAKEASDEELAALEARTKAEEAAANAAAASPSNIPATTGTSTTGTTSAAGVGNTAATTGTTTGTGTTTDATGTTGTGTATGATGTTGTVDDGHTHKFTEKTIAPTVRTQGYTLFTCEICGYSYRSNYTPKTSCNHDYETKVVEPTYTSAGYTRHTCKICGNSYTDSETPMLTCNHEQTTNNVTQATCTSGGYTQHVCQRCKKTWTDSEVAPLGHQWVKDEANSKDATCTEDGKEVTKCSRCGQPGETKVVAKTGHIWVKDEVNSKPATCKEPGYEIMKCSKCNMAGEQKVLNQLDHKFDGGTQTSAPTCTADGVKEYRCTVCGTTKNEAIPKLEHTPGREEVVASTCSTNGSKTVYCSVCDNVISSEMLPKTPHSPQLQGARIATCTEAGYEGDMVCSKCGQTVTRGKVTPATGHKPESSPRQDTVVAATCYSYGYSGDIYCKICNNVAQNGHQTQMVPHTPDYNNPQNASQPDCENAGYTGDIYCSVCHNLVEYGQTIGPKGHNWDISQSLAMSNTFYWVCNDCGKVTMDDPRTTQYQTAYTWDEFMSMIPRSVPDP